MPSRCCVEQRDRRRLVAGQLAVGVVADERAVGDRAVEPRLGRAQALVDVDGDLLDALVQGGERLLQPRGVGDEVGLAVLAEHRLLRRPQLAHAEGEHERQQQRDQRDGARRQGGDARRIGQVVHEPEGYESA